MADLADLAALVDAADAGELLLAVDRLASTRDWDALTDLGRRCMDAGEMGRQLWPVAMHIDYRLAWEGPAAHAAAVLRPGAARFALGPLTEVAASTHEWSALAPHLREEASAGAVAQERVLRGEDLRGSASASSDAAARAVCGAELPLALAAWEPAYALPRYRDRSAQFPPPALASRGLGAPERLVGGTPLAGDDAGRALRETVEVWESQSSGLVAEVAVEGDVRSAVGALVPEAAVLQVPAAEAVALLQWAGASGGAYGRRPGGARGRFAAWWALAALVGLDWPVDADELGQAVSELRWHRWSPTETETGWVLRLAVEDPVDGLAWALDATDSRTQADEEPPQR